MSSVIPSGSIPPPAMNNPWWSRRTVPDDKIPPGTMAVVKPYVNGLIRHEWADEIVVIVDLVQVSETGISYYKVACHRGSMIVCSNDLNIID